MKKLILFITCLLAATNTLWAGINYDFYAKCSSGQRLYYKYNNGSSGTSVMVTYPNYKYASYGKDYYYNEEIPIGNLVIPSSVTYNGKTYSVTGIGEYAFYGCTRLTSVTIENGSIGNYAFYKCSGLTSVSIGSGVTRIGYEAFRECTRLTSVTIPNSVTSIGDYAFRSCSGITSVTIENGSIGDGAFYNCSGLTSVSIGSGVTRIGESAFSGCSKLTSVTIPNSVTSIGESAFSGCSKLTSVTIPNSVTSIGDYAFSGCSGITSVTIPNSVTSIGKSAFSGCSKLTSVTIPNSVTSIGDFAFSGCSGITSVTIENGSIGVGAFYNCSGLTSVSIGSGVTRIGESAFSGCSGLTSITIGNGVTNIGKSAFYGCIGLTTVNFNATNCTTMGSSGSPAFSNCSNLKTLNIGENVKTIPDAFYSCSGLTAINVDESNTAYKSIDGVLYNKKATTLICCPAGKTGSVTIPNSVTSIKDGAFTDCSGITTVNFNAENCTSMGSYNYPVFKNCSNLKTITIGENVKTIPAEAFYGCSGLTAINVDEGNTAYKSIDGVLYDKKATTLIYCPEGKTGSFTIPNSVTSIKDGAFENTGWWNNQSNGIIYKDGWCLGYKGSKPTGTLSIQEGTKGIAGGAFSQCNGLTSITIPNSVTSIGNGAFYGCSKLTSVTIPNSVTSIGFHAFCETGWYNNQSNGIIYKNGWCLGYKGNKSTGTLTILEGTKGIAGSAFYQCEGLTSITIPNSVTSIGEATFAYCTRLTSITCKAVTPPAIEEYSFAKGYNNGSYTYFYDTPLYVPAGSVQAYKNHAIWGKFTNIYAIGSENPNPYNPNAIAEANGSNAQIFGGEKRIVINNAANATVAIYDVMGRTVVKEQRINTNNAVFAVPQTGIYIVRMGKAAKKVWVR